jgi:hypothetical protein
MHHEIAQLRKFFGSNCDHIAVWLKLQAGLKPTQSELVNARAILGPKEFARLTGKGSSPEGEL